MPRLHPFVGLRFDPARVGSFERVTAPPYDVISSGEHARLLAASPYNVIRLDLGRIPGRFENDDQRYDDAARELRAWREDGILVPTPTPAYYPYEMRFSLHGRRRRVRGVLGAVELEEFGNGIVPHERTMAGPVTDRLRLLRAMRANLSSVYAVFEGPSRELAAWLDDAAAGEPDAELVDVDGVEHVMWTADPQPGVAGTLDGVSLLIADGHHRYATALRYRKEQRAELGPGPWDLAMMFVVDATLEQPPVLPYHRIQVAGEAPTAGSRVRDLEEVLESVDDDKLLYGVVTWEDGALVHRVDEVTGRPPVVCRLHEQQLAGADDRLRYTPDAVAAEAAVRGRQAVAAYLLPATDAVTIRTVVDAGAKLPQKSTFFWPKPRTGLVIRPHELD
ncbi:MAG TPA: DUF1015 domain-containing protein [Actinomycetota bacterium]|nr:DUF1015 domain-containing protein [Actinomycetota bacterium]